MMLKPLTFTPHPWPFQHSSSVRCSLHLVCVCAATGTVSPAPSGKFPGYFLLSLDPLGSNVVIYSASAGENGIISTIAVITVYRPTPSVSHDNLVCF